MNDKRYKIIRPKKPIVPVSNNNKEIGVKINTMKTVHAFPIFDSRKPTTAKREKNIK